MQIIKFLNLVIFSLLKYFGSQIIIIIETEFSMVGIKQYKLAGRIIVYLWMRSMRSINHRMNSNRAADKETSKLFFEIIIKAKIINAQPEIQNQLIVLVYSCSCIILQYVNVSSVLYQNRLIYYDRTQIHL